MGERLRRFAETVPWHDVERSRSRQLHYRRAASEAEARAARGGRRASAGGRARRPLRPHGARAAPAARRTRAAVRHLLGERGLRRALYAGDDTTDLDAFAAVETLELGVPVASPRRGPAQLREAADVVVDGPPSCSASCARSRRPRAPLRSPPRPPPAGSGRAPRRRRRPRSPCRPRRRAGSPRSSPPAPPCRTRARSRSA